MEKNKNGQYEYETPSGVFEWSNELAPRKASGFINERMVLVHLRLDEAQQLKQKLNSTATNHRDLETDILKSVGINRVAVAKTDKTPTTKAQAWIDKFCLAISKAKTTPTIEQIEAKINGVKDLPKSLKSDIIKHFTETYKKEAVATEIEDIGFD